ncbi:MAG: stress protein, partial [Bacteroidota bacterium]
MAKLFSYIVISLSLFLTPEVYGQTEFKIVPISTVETSYNTVTCTVHQVDSQNYLYAAGDGNKIDLFKIEDDGSMQFLTNYVVSGGKNSVRGIIIEKIGSHDFLFAGLKGGNAVEVYQINPDGTLKSVFVLPDTDTTYLGIVITLQVIHMETASYLFVGGLEQTPGLSAFRITEEGKLVHVQSMADSEEVFTDGIIGMSTHQIDGKTFLFTGGFQDNGLSSFRV